MVKIYVFWSISKRAWQNGSTAPPGTQPIHFPSTDLHENLSQGVSWPIIQKSLLEHSENRNRKCAILNLAAILAIFHTFTLTYLSYGFYQINFKFRWVSSQQHGHTNCLEFQLFVTPCDRGVASKFDETPWKHEVLYLRHNWSNRLQTTHVPQHSRPDDVYTQIMT